MSPQSRQPWKKPLQLPTEISRKSGASAVTIAPTWVQVYGPKDASNLMLSSQLPLRPAWVEIDLGVLRRNYELINEDKAQRAPQLKLTAVLKDDAYGHGAVRVA